MKNIQLLKIVLSYLQISKHWLDLFQDGGLHIAQQFIQIGSTILPSSLWSSETLSHISHTIYKKSRICTSSTKIFITITFIAFISSLLKVLQFYLPIFFLIHYHKLNILVGSLLIWDSFDSYPCFYDLMYNPPNQIIKAGESRIRLIHKWKVKKKCYDWLPEKCCWSACR